MRTTITIARQLGCGASIIGQSIAQELGIRCIDREIVSQTARQLQIDEEELANREERVSSFWDRILSGMAIVAPEAAYVSAPNPTLTDQEIFASETEVMKGIAAAEDCVIVGRAAAHVLPAHPGMINIYLHAPASFRVPRIREYYDLPDEAAARATLKNSDDMRAKAYLRDVASNGNQHV
jgi:cytidylate kinase